MPHYCIISSAAMADASEDLEAVKAQAQKMAVDFCDVGEDFVVVEVKEIGRMQVVKPVWIEPDTPLVPTRTSFLPPNGN